MANYLLSPKAEEDIRNIWRSIAPENEPAADALLMRLMEKFELAASQPMMGVAQLKRVLPYYSQTQKPKSADRSSKKYQK